MRLTGAGAGASLGRKIAANLGALTILVAGVFGVIALARREHGRPSVREAEAAGEGPITRFRYYDIGGMDPELFCEPRPGATLGELFDMSLFEDLTPGTGLDTFQRRHGSKQYQGRGAVLEAGFEQDRDAFGTVTFRPLYAFPKQGSGGIDLQTLDSVIVTEIRRTNFAGLLILTDSADTERLFVTVDDGKIIRIRWVRLAA
jgi:hypothetical protein